MCIWYWYLPVRMLKFVIHLISVQMKKLLLCIPVLAIASFAHAQNFTINDGSSNVQGTTQNYSVPSTSLDTRAYTVTNTNSTSVTLKVKKVNLALNDPGAST